MSEPNGDLPWRQLTRLRAEYSSALLERRSFPEQLMLAGEFAVLVRYCLRDWVHDGTFRRPERIERTITTRQIAASLNWPAETTRRRVGQLRDLGIATMTQKGVALATTPENAALVIEHLIDVHDQFIRLLEDMNATCELDLPVAPVDTATAEDVVERAADTILGSLDTFRIAGRRMGFLLWGALTVVAVRGVTYDPELSRRYANEMPPDTLREGVSLRRLADVLAIPYATAWRHIQTLHEKGLVARLGNDRWTVLVSGLMHDAAQHAGTPPSLMLYRRIRELALLGLDPARAAERYIRGRPPLADLGMSRPV